MDVSERGKLGEVVEVILELLGAVLPRVLSGRHASIGGDKENESCGCWVHRAVLSLEVVSGRLKEPFPQLVVQSAG